MRLAMIGLGKMGGNMAQRLIKAGHDVAGYDHLAQVVNDFAEAGKLIPAESLPQLISLLEQPRVVWIMVPAGEPTEQTILQLAELLSPGDILIDGGNSNYNDSRRRGRWLKEREINFLDVGVSGGVWGLENGYSLMIGGERQAVDQIRPIFESLAPAVDRGWGHVGPNGAGHFTKMIHNGIEYGLMEAYAEGFELLRARDDMALDMHQVAEIWRTGSVVRSWLLDLIAAALQDDPDLSHIRGWVADSGEGRWTVVEAIENSVPAPVIALALFRRFSSRQEDSYAAKLLAAMRNQFGGHSVLPADTEK